MILLVFLVVLIIMLLYIYTAPDDYLDDIEKDLGHEQEKEKDQAPH